MTSPERYRTLLPRRWERMSRKRTPIYTNSRSLRFLLFFPPLSLLPLTTPFSSSLSAKNYEMFRLKMESAGCSGKPSHVFRHANKSREMVPHDGYCPASNQDIRNRFRYPAWLKYSLQFTLQGYTGKRGTLSLIELTLRRIVMRQYWDKYDKVDWS